VAVTKRHVGFALMSGKSSLCAFRVYCPCSPKKRGSILIINAVSCETIAQGHHIARIGDFSFTDRRREDKDNFPIWPLIRGGTVSAPPKPSQVVSLRVAIP
jgi:hypothetical protein